MIRFVPERHVEQSARSRQLDIPADHRLSAPPIAAFRVTRLDSGTGCPAAAVDVVAGQRLRGQRHLLDHFVGAGDAVERLT